MFPRVSMISLSGISSQVINFKHSILLKFELYPYFICSMIFKLNISPNFSFIIKKKSFICTSKFRASIKIEEIASFFCHLLDYKSNS